MLVSDSRTDPQDYPEDRVLILVLVDVGLGLRPLRGQGSSPPPVLILVLVDVGLGPGGRNTLS